MGCHRGSIRPVRSPGGSDTHSNSATYGSACREAANKCWRHRRTAHVVEEVLRVLANHVGFRSRQTHLETRHGRSDTRLRSSITLLRFSFAHKRLSCTRLASAAPL